MPILKKTSPKTRIIPLGGLGEIGKNITAFESENDIIIVDCGITFPDENMPGIDAVIPDFTYLENNFSKIRGIFVTHGHEDHIGALPYLLKKINVPIYSTKFTIALIKRKLEEEEMADVAQLEEVHYGDIVIKGDFAVEFIRTNHSISDSCAFAIMTPSGVVIHTGDFKVDYTPIDNAPIDLMRLAELGENGVLLLMSDSTNAERKGFTMSERTVGATFDDLFSKITGRIIIATFSSNIHRVQQIIDIAAKFGRKCAICGRSMVNVVEVAVEIGYIKHAEDTIIDIEDVNDYNDNEIVIITTGSQGEPMSALTRMASATHNQVEVSRNDTIIISASPIPGNEKAIARMIDELFKRGANVIYKALADVHVSGHACEEELKLILSITRPRYFMPVHGEYRHLVAHAGIAKRLGMSPDDIFIMGNGNVLEFRGPDLVIREEQVESGNVLIDGLGVGDVGNLVLRDRKHLAADGLVVISLAVSDKDGSILKGPDIVSRGFAYSHETENVLTQIADVAVEAYNFQLAQSRERSRSDLNLKRTAIKDSVRAFIFENTKQNPMIIPVIMEVGAAPEPDVLEDAFAEIDG
ncbi:MAG: ribonuclease J [Clostridia bacterium]|nr:ribonuclease J [Clostridia bacterium]MBO7398294.1 ribonuclease J [Clostridia bacterium]MBO7659341.1 ribonuclease J [Clostridia bacterium]MBP5665760.1 ribonuclease J [Clostridia bacterium]MBP5765398.1 ribonuclease J [Clostridia bacterium]